MHSRQRPASMVRAAFGAVAMLAAGFLSACDAGKLLEVEAPSRIPFSVLENPANAVILLNGAISDFDCAYGTYVVVGGLIGNELEDLTQTAARWPYDRRTVQSNQGMYATGSCNGGLGIYSPLQTARVSANNARRLLEGWTDAQLPAGTNRQLLIATAAAYEAWSMLLLGEAFCTTVFSTLDGQAFNYGTEISRLEAFQQAEARFTQAVDVATAVGTAGASIRNMALLGRARAQLDQGDVAGARADAALIPAGFVYNVTNSGATTRRNNRVYAESNTLGASSSVGSVYRAMNDPRVPYQDLNRPNSFGVPMVAQLKYTSVSAPIPLATYDEARLMIAEADVSTAPANTVAIIDVFRARGGQGPYTGPTDAASLLAEVVDQRQRTLFLQGTHLGDLWRYDIPFRNPTGAAYPAGEFYGAQACSDGNVGLPLPDAERQNNPRLR